MKQPLDTSTAKPAKPAQPSLPASKPAGKSTTPRRRTLLYGGLLLALVVGGLIVWLAFFNKPKTAPVLTEPAAFADVEKTVLATGTLVPFLQIDVGSRASGMVTSLKVDVGDSVQKGDVIADIDSATQTNNLNTARAALTDIQAQKVGDEANLNQAQAAYDRARLLYAADAGPQADAETALKTLKNAKSVLASVTAQISQAAISVQTASVNLGYTRIVAPFSGTVLVVATKQGQTVNAAQSAPTIITLGQLDKMTIEAQIAEADVINVRPGMPVYFTILGDPDHRYYGRLRRIEPAPTAYVSAAASTVTSSATAIYYYGLFDVDNPDGRLKTTMTANVSIVLQQAKHVLSIPSAALSEAAPDGGFTVQVLGKNKKSTPRRVVVGINDGSKAQILSGLAVGEQVVVGAGSAATPSAATPAARTRTPGMPRTVGGL